MEITGAALFVEALKKEKVEILFGYPGGQAIDLFDALYDQRDIEVILPRHEQGLVHAADGYARSTGKVGVCLVTSGPGATNLVTGIATADYDSVPLVCFTGQVPTHLIGNDAFQEVDIVGITSSICKYAVTVRKREDLGNVRQWQEMFYNKRYSSTCLLYRKSCGGACGDPDRTCPEYTPDFVMLAESYGAKGIRVKQAEDIASAFYLAKNNVSGPTIIEFIIDREENVLPIVPPGNAISEMIMK